MGFRDVEVTEATRRTLRITGIAVAAAALVGTVAAVLIRDQIGRAERDLFHPLALKRMAALENLSRQEFTVDVVNLLRDYVAWEPRPLLRNRARTLLLRLENTSPEIPESSTESTA